MFGIIRTRRDFDLEMVSPMTFQCQKVIDHTKLQFPRRYSIARQDDETSSRDDQGRNGGFSGMDIGGENEDGDDNDDVDSCEHGCEERQGRWWKDAEKYT